MTLALPKLAGQTLVARDYLRVSRDKSGRARSPEEQHDENQEDSDERGWVLGPSYQDLGSASRYQRRRRPDFDMLIEDLRNDRFNADILILWVSARGSRKVGEWVELLDLLELRGVLVYVTTHKRVYDPSVRRDWKTLMDDALDAENTAREISEQVLRSVEASVKNGDPYGRCPYGFRRIYDEKTRRLIRQEGDPVEAPVVAEVIDRLYDKHSLKTIEQDFDRRGIRTRSGKKWTANHLRDIALNYAYIGKKVHDPDRWKPGMSRHWTTGNARIVDAKWPAIVDVDKWYVVQKRFAARRGVFNNGNPIGPRNGRANHLLTGQPGVVCDVCNAVLSFKENPNSGALQYRCSVGGHVTVLKADLDALMIDIVLTYLAQPDNFEPESENDDEELACVEVQLAEQQAEHDGLAQLSVGLAAKMEPAILAKIADLEERARQLRMPSELDGPLHPGADIAERWHDENTSLDAQRAVIRALTVPRYLGQVRVLRSPVAGRNSNLVPVEDRVRFDQG